MRSVLAGMADTKLSRRQEDHQEIFLLPGLRKAKRRAAEKSARENPLAFGTECGSMFLLVSLRAFGIVFLCFQGH